MSKKNKYHEDLIIPWYTVNDEINIVLKNFYLKNKENSGKNLYKLCIGKKGFVLINRWIEKFANEFDVSSLDPIHIYASINASGQSDENRTNKINTFFEAIGSEKRFTRIDFNGCPTPFFIKLVSPRNDETQIDIWSFFYRVLTRKQQALNQSSFDKIKNWFGVDISSFTIFLFWVSSENFLPLDKNTVELLRILNIFKKKPSKYNEYKKLLPKQNSPLYREIAKAAVDVKSKNFSNATLKELTTFFNSEFITQFQATNFRFLAVRPLNGIDPKIRKILLEEKVYPFYSCFDFSDINCIRYDVRRDVKIYDIREGEYNLDINISAIVGKNGSGKSSITELIYLILNNFTKEIFKDECEVEFQSNVHAELYYFLDTIYRIEVHGESARVLKYEQNENIFINPYEVAFDQDDLHTFFYSIAINYSHFSLNSQEIGNWIIAFFHKNDGYEIPLVISPMRTKGNINVNIENSLVISRLLTNILQPVSTDPNILNLRMLSENGRSADKLRFIVDESKAELKPEDNSLTNEEHQNFIIKEVYRFFKIPEIDTPYKSIADKYIYRKLNSIVRTYSDYTNLYFPLSKLNLTLLRKLLKKIDTDKSHKVFKIKRAINFLKYDHLKFHDLSKDIEVEILSNRIQRIIEQNPKENLDTTILIPPSFFKTEILLDDKSSFEYLSSGEKQRIYTVSSLVYHLLNLNSVSSELIKYSYVNIIFDEIELYFHPEMQRSFISYIINYLKRIQFNDLYGINFCFITHSPFILSDIPSNNILFLKADATPVNETEKLKTFGANIHNLLSDSFFLDNGFMGKYSEEKINEVISWALDENSDLSKKEQMLRIIDIIDDPIIKIKLVEMYAKKVGDNMEVARLKVQQEYITNRLKELGDD